MAEFLELGKGDLVPGQKLNLAKTSSTELSNIRIALGWDENNKGGHDFDPDVCLVMLDAAGTNCKVEDFYFYNNLVSKDGSQRHNPTLGKYEVVRPGYITHNGDNRTGAGDGDDETIDICLAKIPANLVMGIITVTIHKAEERNQNFGMMENAYVRILNKDTNEQLGKLDLEFDASTATGVIFGALIYKNDTWHFSAPSNMEVITGGLDGVANKFKIGQ